jgi:hypothetical protein
MNAQVERVIAPVDSGLMRLSPKKKSGEKIKIVFATSRYDDELAEIFIPALEKLLTQYRDRLEVHLWGMMKKKMNSDGQVIFHRLILDYRSFLRRFSREGFDIGLAPLKDDIFHRSKSNNKFREYGACGIAGIYSDVEVYSDCVVDGETGLLVANDAESWFQAMVRLIEDEQLRKGIQKKAKEYVQTKYASEMFEKLWLQQIQRLLKGEKREIRRSDSSVLRPFPQESTPRTPFGFLRTKEQIQKIRRHMQKSGIKWTLFFLGQFLYGRWMVVKMRVLILFPIGKAK